LLQSYDLDKNRINIEGSCLRLSAWEIKESVSLFLGEMFYPIQYIQNMERISNINFMPVIIKQLIKPSHSEIERLQVIIFFKPSFKRPLKTLNNYYFMF
jgi:hypothetical protein